MSAARLAELAWPAGDWGGAVRALATHTRVAQRVPGECAEGLAPSAAIEDTLARERLAASLGIEIEPVELPIGEATERLTALGPALLPIGDGRLAAVVRSGRRGTTLLTPAGRRCRVRTADLAAALVAPYRGLYADAIEALVQRAGLRAGAAKRASGALLAERIQPLRSAPIWLLQPAPHQPLWDHARHAGLGRATGIFLAAHAAQLALFVFSWWMLGAAALGGRLDAPAATGWALLMLLAVPLRAAAGRAQARLAVGLSALLRQRMLVGALRGDVDAARARGAGDLLARVMESEAFGALALGGAFAGCAAIFELAMAGLVLTAGPHGAARLGVFLLWMGLLLVASRRYVLSRGRWTDARIALTQGLVERMVAHRTRLAQDRPERWHAGEDETVADATRLGRQMDRRGQWLSALLGRGWLAVGLATLLPLLLSGGTPMQLAAALGGVLLGATALSRLSAALTTLADALIAGRRIAPIYAAAARPPQPGDARLGSSEQANDAAAVLTASHVTFAYRNDTPPVLDGVSVAVAPGDRILIEGPSGGGKSTLAQLLAGMRRPRSGLIRRDGLDLASWGEEAWRRGVALVPQFHENHVLTGTFAFNLLMGRSWPPRERDLVAAGEVCQALGLGELLSRMPAGLQQMLGESGWQLSHGERSRLFLARALLADPRVLIVDESFAALDPQTLGRCLAEVDARARTLLVIAHP